MFQRNDHSRDFANFLIPFNISFEYICFTFKKKATLWQKNVKKNVKNDFIFFNFHFLLKIKKHFNP